MRIAEMLTASSNPFRRTQFRAAGPRITINLFFAGGHWLFCEQPVVSLPHSITESIFDDAVLQRVEADHDQAPARLQQLRGCFEQVPQVVQFAVYEDSESLKGSGRRINSPLCLIHWPGRG